jgi:two-component system response regulator PilR (NtrC family)
VALSAGEILGPQDLARDLGGSRAAKDLPAELTDTGIDLERRLEDLREHFMSLALDRAEGVQTRAAELLGMSFRSFRYFAKKYHLLDGRREPRAGAA